MRENPELIALAEALAGDPLGTPAGNAPYSQEQYDVMRARNMREGEYGEHPALISIRPAPLSAIPANKLPPKLVRKMCPVIGWYNVSPMLKAPVVINPDGTIGFARW